MSFFRNGLVKLINIILLAGSFGVICGYFDMSVYTDALNGSGTYDMEFYIPLIAIAVLIYSLIMTLVVTGHTNDSVDDSIEFNFFDGIYSEILLLSSILITLIFSRIITQYSFESISMAILSGAYFFALVILLLPIVKHIKDETTVESTLIYDICLLFKNIYDRANRGQNFRGRARNNIIVIFVLCLIPIIGWIIALIICFKWRDDLACDLEDLKEASGKVKSGEYEINIEEIVDPDIKDIAYDIKSIRDNINKVVDEKVKDREEKIDIILNASYDLKNPLESILESVAQLEADMEASKTSKKYIDIIKHRAERLKVLSNEINNASKKEKLKEKALKLEEVDIFPFLTRGLSEIEQEMKRSNMHIKLNIKKPKLIAIADKNLLWRAFENLIKDIFKYGEENSNVYISIEETSNVAMISLKNEIKDEIKEKLDMTTEEFNEKYLKDTTKRTSLIVAKNLIEKQGGKLKVTLEDGTFNAIIAMRIARQA